MCASRVTMLCTCAGEMPDVAVKSESESDDNLGDDNIEDDDDDDDLSAAAETAAELDQAMADTQQLAAGAFTSY